MMVVCVGGEAHRNFAGDVLFSGEIRGAGLAS